MTKITETSMPSARAEFRLLSMDPGTDNFGYAALAFKNKRVVIKRCGMLDETIKDLKDPQTLADDALRYVNRFDFLLRKSGAQYVGAERYVPRRQGLSNESVNMMLGTAVAYASTLGIMTSVYLAATWKLRLKKVLDLEALYARCKPVPDHVVDAVFIGLFTAERLGIFDMASLSKTQQTALCKSIQSQFLDLRTGARKEQAQAQARLSAAKRKRRQQRRRRS